MSIGRDWWTHAWTKLLTRWTVICYFMYFVREYRSIPRAKLTSALEKCNYLRAIGIFALHEHCRSMIEKAVEYYRNIGLIFSRYYNSRQCLFVQFVKILTNTLLTRDISDASIRLVLSDWFVVVVYWFVQRNAFALEKKLLFNVRTMLNL